MPRPRRTKHPPPAWPKADRAGRLLVDPQVARPLPSLIFLSPFLAFYALGLIWVRPDWAARADILIRQVIAPLGLTGVLAPTWLVVAILLVWHLLRRDPVRVSGRLLGRMAAETILLAIPLFAIFAASYVVLHGYFSLELPAVRAAEPPPAIVVRTAGGPPAWAAVAMTSIGAGIYEELLFRLLLVGGPLWVARKVLGLESGNVVVAVVLVSAALFAGAHTLDDPRRFAWDSFLFRTAAGAYLATVFARRGFGIAAGVHMVFDLVVKLSALLRVAA